MVKKKTPRLVKRFSMNRRTGHISLPFFQRGKKVKSIGFTHDKKCKDTKVELKHNIDTTDKQPCFAKTKVENYSSSDYKPKKKYSGFRIHQEDKPKIESIINNNKNKK